MSNFKCQISNIKLLIFGYFLVIFGLFLYSFTQVDLGLTLTKISLWQGIQKFLQHIGYFNRPLSTILYSSIILLLYIFYILFLFFSYKKKISKKQILVVVSVVGIIAGLAYNAFSYDLFNYIFDAKIITFYHQNPYIQKALDFPNDPMLAFMHWTHRVYPYGPIWLLLTVPLSFIGLQFFLPTLILFKVLNIFCFFGIVYFISKILKKIAPQFELSGIVFFALNPLTIIEGLVSAHNDLPMMFLAIVSVYLILEKKYLASFIILLFSIGTKYATVSLIPVFLIVVFSQIKKREINYEIIFRVTLLTGIIPLILSSTRTEMQPWYLLWMLPFAALLVRNLWVVILFTIFSFGLLITYIPFLYSGNWDPPIPGIKTWLIIGFFTASILASAIFIIKNKVNILNG